jgi:hypothetical protein
MSNIRDLQKLRGNKNIYLLAQTQYKNVNPEKYQQNFDFFKEQNLMLTSRSPKKQNRESDESKSPLKINTHRRGGSIGSPSPMLKNSDIQFNNPRISMYFTLYLDITLA